MKKIYIIILFILAWIFLYFYNYLSEIKQCKQNDWIWKKNYCEIYSKIKTNSDIDNDFINDIDDLLLWARKEVTNKIKYKDAYYSWWYPPNSEWVCADVIRRWFKEMWVNLKDLLDEDISKNITNYPRTNWKPDPNIDFRRVLNLDIFFSKYAENLTLELSIWDKENLEKWQWWDIIVFAKPNQHIAIISDKRDENWVPYLIHNPFWFAREDNRVFYEDKKNFPIVWHYRWKY